MVPAAKRPTRACSTRIWIVDSRPADYDCLRLGSKTGPLDVRFLATGHDVLRRWSLAPPDVCMVNVQLPGLSGFDLVEMLRPFPAATTVCLVDDRYVVENEVRSLSLGVHHYLCKPLEGAVLSECCARRRVDRSAAPSPMESAAFPRLTNEPR
jgi:DNA-binding response OmpR family regulator